MIIKKIILILIVVLFANIGLCVAEPTPSISYLMKTPVSMFDFGMHRLNIYLAEKVKNRLEELTREVSVTDSKLNVRASYDWAKNRIIIGTGTMTSFNDVKTAKKLCKSITQSIKNHLNVFATGPAVYGISLLGVFFSHIGYESTSEPESLAKELETITEIQVSLSFKKDGILNLFSSESALMEEAISFSEANTGIRPLDIPSELSKEKKTE